jgi:hypothetical protein
MELTALERETRHLYPKYMETQLQNESMMPAEDILNHHGFCRIVNIEVDGVNTEMPQDTALSILLNLRSQHDIATIDFSDHKIHENAKKCLTEKEIKKLKALSDMCRQFLQRRGVKFPDEKTLSAHERVLLAKEVAKSASAEEILTKHGFDGYYRPEITDARMLCSLFDLHSVYDLAKMPGRHNAVQILNSKGYTVHQRKKFLEICVTCKTILKDSGMQDIQDKKEYRAELLRLQREMNRTAQEILSDHGFGDRVTVENDGKVQYTTKARRLCRKLVIGNMYDIARLDINKAKEKRIPLTVIDIQNLAKLKHMCAQVLQCNPAAERNLEANSYHKAYLKYISHEHNNKDDWNEVTALKELADQKYPDVDSDDDDDEVTALKELADQKYQEHDSDDDDDRTGTWFSYDSEDDRDDMDSSDKAPWSEYPNWDSLRERIRKPKHETDEGKLKAAAIKRRTRGDSVDEIRAAERIIRERLAKGHSVDDILKDDATRHEQTQRKHKQQHTPAPHEQTQRKHKQQHTPAPDKHWYQYSDSHWDDEGTRLYREHKDRTDQKERDALQKLLHDMAWD